MGLGAFGRVPNVEFRRDYSSLLLEQYCVNNSEDCLQFIDGSVEWKFPTNKVDTVLEKACNADPRPHVVSLEIDLSAVNQDKAMFTYNLSDTFCGLHGN